MSNTLSKEALKKLSEDQDLQLAVSKALHVKVASIPVMIFRNSRRLTEYQPLLIIAKAIGKEPEEIISVVKKKQKPKVTA